MTRKKSSSSLNSRITINFTKFLLIVTTPLVCLFGIVTNALIVHVISHKSSQKELKESQYEFMRANAIVNLPILFIQIVLLFTECQYPFGVLCLTVRKSYFFQYFKIIFGEYLSTLFKLLSNFTYVCFALCRLSLIGKDHSALTLKVAKLSPKSLFKSVFIPCAAFCVVKSLRFIVNHVQIEEQYPVPVGFYYNILPKYLIIIYLSFNLFVDFVNYVFFWLVNLVIDVNLVLSFRQILKAKAQNTSNLTLKKEKKEGGGDDPVEKLIKMIVLNAFVGLLLKATASFVSLYDFVGLIKFFVNYSISLDLRFALYLNLIRVCSNSLVCSMFEELAVIFYCLSLSINLFFIYKFDKKFKIAFDVLL